MLPTSGEPYYVPLFIFCAMTLITTKNEAIAFVRILGPTTGNCLESIVLLQNYLKNLHLSLNFA